MWTIPFPERASSKGRRRKKQQGDGRRRDVSQPAAEAAAAAAAAGNRRPAWDATLTDHEQYRLTQEEQAFRQSLRQSRHRLRNVHGGNAATHPGHAREAHDELLALEEVLRQQQEGQEARGSPGDGAAPCLPGSGEWESKSDGQSSCSDGAASLSGMRAFVAQLQCRYGLQGGPQAGPSAAAPPAQPLSAAQQKLLQLQPPAAAAAGAHEARQPAAPGEDDGGAGGSSSSGGEERDAQLSRRAAARRGSASAAPPQGDDASDASNSGGEGRLGPAALRRAQQRLAAATAAADAPEPPPSGQQAAAPAQQGVMDRLAAAEAQLARLGGVEAQLQQALARVTALEGQSARLQTDLDNYVSHTSTLLTSLQSQLSAILSGQAGSIPTSLSAPADAAACGLRQQQQQQPPSPQQLPPAVVQARAVAAALSIARQAQAGTAAGDAPTSPLGSQPLQGDALADVQLPTFAQRFAQRFAAAQAAAVGKLAPAAAGHPTPAAAPSVLAPTGSARWRGGGENSPPQPRALPQSLQQRGAAAGKQPAQAAGAAGFQWRPLSAAS